MTPGPARPSTPGAARAQAAARRPLALALAVAGGLALALGGEPWSFNPAAFASLWLLYEALERAEPTARPSVRGAWLGLAFGSTVNAVALYSLVGLLVDFGHFPAPLAFLTAALGWVAQAVPYAASAALTQACALRGLPRWLALPPALAFCLSATPQLFPWHPGATQIDFAPFVQMADLGGEALLDLCMALVGSGFGWALRRRGKQRLAPLCVALGSVLVPCAYGLVRLPQVRAERASAETLQLGVVQSNVGIEMKHDPERTAAVLEDLRRFTAGLERRGAELTVWAETAYPYRLLRSRHAEPGDERKILARGVRGPVLFGAVTYMERGELNLKYNSAWLLRQDGTLGDRVDKSRLLAFGEFVPLWDYLPPLQHRWHSRGFETGENDVIVSGAARLGILICYEDLFHQLARKVVERGANVLVNMTNDAWFGDSAEPGLHDMVARLRAVETRRDFVRVVNTGVSSFSTATGELVERTPTFVPRSFIAPVRLLHGTSPYVALGNWVSPLCALALLAGVLRKRLKKSP